jgi:hypothetical protein
MAAAPNYTQREPQRNPQSQSQEPLSRNTGFVTVASKLPLPLILRIDDMREVSEPVMGGGQRVVQMAEKKAEVQINGVAVRFGETPSCKIVGGYALTPNVSAEFWEQWISKNANSDMIRNGVIFAYEKPDDLKDCVKDHAKASTGLQPLDPENDTRAPRQIEKGVKKPA